MAQKTKPEFSAILGFPVTYEKPLIKFRGGHQETRLHIMFGIFFNNATWVYRQYKIHGILPKNITFPNNEWRQNLTQKVHVFDWNATQDNYQTILEFYNLFGKKPLLKSFAEIETEMKKNGYVLTEYTKLSNSIELFHAVFTKP